MKARYLPLLAALILSPLFAAPAHAECIDEEFSGWSFEPRDNHEIAADGALVLTAYYQGRLDFLPDAPAELTVTDVEGIPVPGTLEVLRPDDRPRLVWRPDATLEPGQTLTMEFTQSFDTTTVDLDVVESIALPEVSISELNRREVETAAERRCCDTDPTVDFCDDPCSSGCEQCGIEEFVYPVVANFRADVNYGTANDIYVIQHEVLRTDETPFESTTPGINYATRGSFTAFGATIPTDAEGFCVKYAVINDLTGEIMSSDTVCSEDVPLSEASRNEPTPLDTSVCVGDTVRVISQDGTVEQVPLDGSGGTGGTGGGGDGTKAETGGCATGSGEPAGLLLILVGLGLLVRRREVA